MIEMYEDVTKLVREEIKRANKVNPPFHSGHEAYGVMEEEIREVIKELAKVITCHEVLFERTMADDGNNSDAILTGIRHAKLMACEAIQVAAMFVKYGESNGMGRTW